MIGMSLKNNSIWTQVLTWCFCDFATLVETISSKMESWLDFKQEALYLDTICPTKKLSIELSMVYSKAQCPTILCRLWWTFAAFQIAQTAQLTQSVMRLSIEY